MRYVANRFWLPTLPGPNDMHTIIAYGCDHPGCQTVAHVQIREPIPDPPPPPVPPELPGPYEPPTIPADAPIPLDWVQRGPKHYCARHGGHVDATAAESAELVDSYGANGEADCD